MPDESNVDNAKRTVKETAGKLGAAAKGATEGFREEAEQVKLKQQAKESGTWAKETAQSLTEAAGKEVRKTGTVVADPERTDE